MLINCIKVWIALVLLGASLVMPVNAEENNRGTITGFDATAQRIMIDEGTFVISNSVKIKNAAGGLSGTAALREGTPIIFNTAPNGTVTEITVLPKSEHEQRKLGYGAETNQ